MCLEHAPRCATQHSNSAPPHRCSINATQLYPNHIVVQILKRVYSELVLEAFVPCTKLSLYMRTGLIIIRSRKRAPWTDRDAQAFTGIDTQRYTLEHRATDTAAYLWNENFVLETDHI